jgi:hypothetical protein
MVPDQHVGPTGPEDDAAFGHLLDVQRIIQDCFPEAVLVGGTAAALHAGHRVSLDVDSVVTDLRDRFPSVLERLSELAGWHTRRVRPPVLILGRFEGVDVGIRQLIRSHPLETEEIRGIRVPTLGEMTRIKGWMIVTRNAVRDFLDFSALADRLGPVFVDAMAPMDRLYPQPADADTTLQQLAKQLREPNPYDFDPAHDSLVEWRRLTPQWTDWTQVEAFLRTLSQELMDVLLA